MWEEQGTDCKSILLWQIIPEFMGPDSKGCVSFGFVLPLRATSWIHGIINFRMSVKQSIQIQNVRKCAFTVWQAWRIYRNVKGNNKNSATGLSLQYMYICLAP